MSRVKAAFRSKTAGNSAWALGDQFTSLVSLTISAKLLTNNLGPARYSQFTAIYGLMGPFLAFIQSGMSLAVLDHIVRQKRDPAQVIRSSLGYLWSIGAVLSVVVVVLSKVVNPKVPLGVAMLFIVPEFVVMSGMWATTAMIQATRGYKFAAVVRIIVTACRSALLITLAIAGQLNLKWMASCQAAMFLVLALVIHRWHERTYGARFRPGRYAVDDVKAIGVYGVGLSAVGLQDSYDQVTLNRVNEVAGGYYGAAYKIISAGLMPLNAIANATHMDFLHVDEHSNDQVAKARRFAVLGIAYSVVFCGIVIAAAPLVPKILGDEYQGAVTIIRLLCPLVPLRGIGTFPMNGLLGLGRNKLRTQILVSCAAISLTLYVTMIPAWEWHGVIAAALISEVLLFSAAWIGLFRSQVSYDRNRPLAPV